MKYNVLFHTSPIRKLLLHTKIGALLCISFFHKNCLIVACCTFGRLEIRTLTLNRFKSQTNDTFELLGYNYNDKQQFVMLKIVARYCLDFHIQFPKRFYRDRCFG